MDEDEDFGQDAEEVEQEPDAPVVPAVADSPENAKLRKENHSLRERLRRSELTEKHGADVVELVPMGLPLKEQEALAEKLADKFRDLKPAATEQVDAQVGSQEEPTEQERQLAAVAAGSVSGTPAAPVEMSAKELLELGLRDPAAATRLIQQKYRAQ